MPNSIYALVSSTEARVNPERILAAIPIAVAVLVGLLYAVGALLSAAKFHGAGLSIRDTVPLLPLERILATGIGTLITSALLVVAWVGLGLAAVAVVRRVRDSEAKRIAGIATFGVLAILVVLFATPVLVATFFLIALVAFLAVRAGWGPGLVFAVSYLVAVAGLVVSAFVYPAPLPAAHVVADRQAAPIAGDFVGEDGGIWYVADFDTDRIRAFNLLQVDEASFESRDRDPRPTVLGVFD